MSIRRSIANKKVKIAKIRDYEKKKYKKRHENNPGGACKNDGKLISSVNTIEPSANLVGTMKGDSHSNKTINYILGLQN